jgi:hypothetical protein
LLRGCGRHGVWKRRRLRRGVRGNRQATSGGNAAEDPTHDSAFDSTFSSSFDPTFDRVRARFGRDRGGAVARAGPSLFLVDAAGEVLLLVTGAVPRYPPTGLDLQWLLARRAGRDRRPVCPLDPRRADGQDLRERTPVEAEAAVILLGLENEQRRAGDQDPAFDAQLHLLGREGLPHGRGGLGPLALAEVGEVGPPRLAREEGSERGRGEGGRTGRAEELAAAREEARRRSLAGPQARQDDQLAPARHVGESRGIAPLGAGIVHGHLGAERARELSRGFARG